MDKCNVSYQAKNWKGYLGLSNFQKHFRQLASHREGLPSTEERDPSISISVQTSAQLS